MFHRGSYMGVSRVLEVELKKNRQLINKSKIYDPFAN